MIALSMSQGQFMQTKIKIQQDSSLSRSKLSQLPLPPAVINTKIKVDTVGVSARGDLSMNLSDERLGSTNIPETDLVRPLTSNGLGGDGKRLLWSASRTTPPAGPVEDRASEQEIELVAVPFYFHFIGLE